MTRTYTIPITCKEAHILIFVVCVVLIFYGNSIVGWDHNKPTGSDVTGILMIVLGGTGVILYAIVAIVVYEDKIPRFRCRCDET